MSIGDLSRINTNVQSMKALGQLNKTNSQLGMRQLRLATGSRLNRAEDDSAGYTIANKLQAKTRGQAQALSNIGDAKGMLTVGEGALNSTMDILQTMKEKAIQASNDTLGSEERAAIQSQVSALTSEIGDVLKGAEFNGKSLFGGTDALADGGTGTSLTFQVGASSSDTFGVEIGATSVGTLGSTASAVTVGGGQGAYVTDATFAGDADAAAATYTIAANGANFDIQNAAGDVVAASVTDGQELSFDGFSFTFDSGGAIAASEEFTLAGTASTDTALALDVSTQAGAQASIDQIDGAIAKINKAVSGLGDSQARLTIKQDNLDTSMTNYEAARSRIEDTDFAKEQMEIVKLQILQQTGIGSLAQANSGPQSVLSLIG